MTTDLRITSRTAEERPNYRRTAPELLQRAREFYRDPENERAFQEWKARRDREKKGE